MSGNYNNPCILRLDGANGASYFLNLHTPETWRKSLEFYRGVSFSACCKKYFLTKSRPFWRLRNPMPPPAAAENIRQELGMQVVPLLTENTSALISPTRDKLIVHLHGKSYEKNAFGNSLPGVRRELEVYRTIGGRKWNAFTVSRISESESTSAQVRLKMEYAEGRFDESVPRLDRIVHGLLEFFHAAGTCRVPWNDKWEGLMQAAADLPEIRSRLEQQIPSGTTPLGLVHRDFKPWNVKNGDRLLFFDFEAADFQGCPLEDLLNYVLDPALNHHSPQDALKWCVEGELRDASNNYLRSLGIPESAFPDYLHWYLLERAIFWHSSGRKPLSQNFLGLYDLVIQK